MNLDFYRENYKKKRLQDPEMGSEVIIGPKALMEKCAKEGSKPLKLGCLEIIKILFKAEIMNFALFGYQILLTMLNDREDELKENVVDFLEEHLARTTNIDLFLKCISECVLTKKIEWSEMMKKLSNNILIRLISERTGFNFISKESP